MNTLDLIKKSILLPPTKPSKIVSQFLDEIYISNLWRAGIAMASHIYLSKSPNSKYFVDATASESIEEVIQLSGALTENLNKRFGLSNTLILDAEDPAIFETIAKLPNALLKNMNQPFVAFKKKTGGWGVNGIKSLLLNAYQGFQAEFKHVGAALHGFHHQTEGSDYNPYGRMALAHYIENNQNPQTLSLNHLSDSYDQSVRIISMANGKALDTWSRDGLFDASSLNDLKWFFVFTHELGHAVESRDWKKSLIAALDQHHSSFTEMPNRTEWIGECYADVFSSCLCAKLTGSWDITKAVMMPFRLNESEFHNTYAILDQLAKEDPMALQSMSEREIMLFAAKTTEQLVHRHFELNMQSINQVAGDVYNANHKAALGISQEESMPMNKVEFNQVALRVQTLIDAISTEALYRGGDVSSQDIRYVAAHLRRMGQTTSAKEMMVIADLPKGKRIGALGEFTRAEVSQVADRLTCAVLAVGAYMDELRRPAKRHEMHLEKRAHNIHVSDHSETKTPAF
jgi:hypothetical protein